MPRTPKRLFGPALLTAATATKYTVPASTKTVIRHIHVSNNSAGAVPLTISIGADAAGTRIFDAVPIPGLSVQDYYGYWVVEAAEVIAAFGGTTNLLNLTLNGDENTLG
jgi:hypothetical protein